MKAEKLRCTVLALALFMAGTAAALAATADAPRITKEEAKALLEAPNAVFVDARTVTAWSKSDRKIKGAVRVDKWDLQMWSSAYPDTTIFIVY